MLWVQFLGSGLVLRSGLSFGAGQGARLWPSDPVPGSVSGLWFGLRSQALGSGFGSGSQAGM